MKTKRRPKSGELATPNYIRQMDFFNPEKFENERVEIIGCGGIGSFVAVALAKLGLKKIRVWDGDKLEPHNIPNQFHVLKSVGKPKVNSTKLVCKELAGADVETVPEFWGRGSAPLEGVVITAIDHMEQAKAGSYGRNEIWKALRSNIHVKLLIDCRIGGETIRVLSIRPVNDVNRYEWYERNIFPDKQGADLPCTAKGIIDVGFLVAAIVTKLVRDFLTKGKVTPEIAASVADLSIVKMEVR